MTTGFFFRNVSYNDDAITSFSNVEFFLFYWTFCVWDLDGVSFRIYCPIYSAYIW